MERGPQVRRKQDRREQPRKQKRRHGTAERWPKPRIEKVGSSEGEPTEDRKRGEQLRGDREQQNETKRQQQGVGPARDSAPHEPHREVDSQKR